MARVRVYELAKEFGVESKVVMQRLHDLGIPARSASSTIDAPDVRRLTNSLLGPAATARAEALVSRPFVGHASRMRTVAFSPDGAVVAGGGDGMVRLWDQRTGEEVRSFGSPDESLSSLAFSPDGQLLAGAHLDGVRLWDPTTGEEVRSFGYPASSLKAVAFSPDGQLLAGAHLDGVQLWDPTTGEEVRFLPGWASSLSFSPDGSVLAGAGTRLAEGAAHVWDVRTGQLVRTLTGHNASQAVFSADGRLLASVGESAGEHSVQLWDALSGEPLWTQPDHAVIRAVVFSPDSDLLATASDNGVVRVRGTETGEQRLAFTGLSQTVWGLTFNPDGNVLAGASDDGVVRLWDPRAAEPGSLEVHALTTDGGWIASLVFSPDGAVLASAGYDNTVRLWDAETGEERRNLAGHGHTPRALTFSPDGTLLAGAGLDGVHVWDARTGEEQAIAAHNGPAAAVAFSPDGTLLASADYDHSVRLWDLRTASTRDTFYARATSVQSLAFSSDGGLLAGADLEGWVRVWDTANGQTVHELRHGSEHPGYELLSVAFSPVGSVLACADRDDVWLWNLAVDDQPRTLHEGHASSVAFSGDGTLLATAGDDGLVRVWNPTTGRAVRALTGHTSGVLSVTFSRRGNLLASTGYDGTIRVWDPVTGQQMAGTDTGSTTRLRPLPGLHSDTSSAEDLLGNETDVETLAMLAAAHDSRPPMAIALLGQWGSGKSSFMDQMQTRVDHLASLSANNPGRSAFAANIRQIRFNAWHFSDDHLWTGLVDRLFQSLTDLSGQAPYDTDPERARAEREDLTARVASLEEDQRRLHTELSRAAAARPTGYAASAGSPAEIPRLLFLNGRMVLRDAWRSRWALLTVATVLAVAYFSREWLSTWVSALIGVTGLLVPVVQPALARIRAWQGKGQSLSGSLRISLEQRQQTLEAEVSKAHARLAELDAAVRLSMFLTERGTPTAYQQYRGLLGQVHRDLVQLDTALTEARAQWDRTRPATPPPLERIVLYIDDLDRCPPARVVEVLEAVHLMLALPLFVVVVAIDPRWLLASLQHHYQELFTQDSATPLDYLDKIFQIPYALAPASSEKTGRYLRALLNSRSDTDTTGSTQNESAAPTSPIPSGRHGEGQPSAPAYAGVAEPDRAVRDLFDSLDRPPLRRVRFAMPELQPEQLTLQQAEIEFMERLGNLLPTPRAAKKLVNLYRLVRIGIDHDDLSDFVGTPGTPGTHQVVQILLATLVGHPRHSTVILETIMKADPSDHIADALKACPPEHDPAHTVAQLIEEISTQMPVVTATGRYQTWCADLARFSFHTRTELP
ncbi:translation initiation factor IF-2 N-terminal domain-containing protein [Streptomyces sp. NPDC087859]|uniref:translation initiation factor IF-2 N-terminal domain-containing protein n=1 Tax=Streptomyces sp. NPDC087859 TaxID=3365812 RepID=UPI003830B09F